MKEYLRIRHQFRIFVVVQVFWGIFWKGSAGRQNFPTLKRAVTAQRRPRWANTHTNADKCKDTRRRHRYQQTIFLFLFWYSGPTAEWFFLKFRALPTRSSITLAADPLSPGSFYLPLPPLALCDLFFLPLIPPPPSLDPLLPFHSARLSVSTVSPPSAPQLPRLSAAWIPLTSANLRPVIAGPVDETALRPR